MDDIRHLLQAALVLADEQNEGLIAIRLSDALDTIIARIAQFKPD